jgi:adenosylcobinamide-phosphate synthase
VACVALTSHRYDESMSFFSILFALLLEQARPMARGNPVHVSMRGWVRWVIRSFDAGRTSHGWLAWALAVVGPALTALIIYWLLHALIGWLVAMLWSVAVLYATLGFRQFSYHFTDIRRALDEGDEARARSLLAEWQQIDAGELPRQEIIRHVIEHSVLSAHRHVVGVLVWFSVMAALGLGPAGAVFYRLAEFISRYWPYLSSRQGQPVSKAACDAAGKAWRLVDWVPARITALFFAAVGNFEDAIDNWRNYETLPDADNDGVIVAATAGAVNVRLGQRVATAGEEQASTAAANRQEPELAHLRSIVGLVWRSVVMWMALLALLSLARLLG